MVVANITPPSVFPTSCPPQLRARPIWLMWRYEHADAEVDRKPRKIPYYTTGNRRRGVQGRPDDRAQLVPFDLARAIAIKRKMDGVGFALLAGESLVALDFDHCVDDAGIAPDVLRLCRFTYAELSPSGQGVRAIYLGDLGNRKDFTGAFGFEVFSTSGFVTFTGAALDHVADLATFGDRLIVDAPAEVVTYCETRLGARRAPASADDWFSNYEPPLGWPIERIAAALDPLDPNMDREPWLHLGMAVHHETGGSPDGFEVWRAWSEPGKRYALADLESDWASFKNDRGGRVVTLRSLIRASNAAGGHFDDRAEIDPAAFDQAATAAAGPVKFEVVPAHLFMAEAAPGWLIRGVIPRAELVVVYGASGSGKSFFALDLAGAILRGGTWRGLKTTRGRVVYICAEGRFGFRSRLIAYCKKNAIDLETFSLGVLAGNPNFLLRDDAIEVARAIGRADLVIVDTWAQVTPGGNENSGDDMGKALAHCRGIHRATGATILLIHHAGKDEAKGARGWSGLRAAADAEIVVERLPGGRVARITKQKDSTDDAEYGFDLEIVQVGVDADGEPITSCVLTEATVGARITPGAAATLRGTVQRVALTAIDEALLAGEPIPFEEIAAAICEKLRPPKNGARDRRLEIARQALRNLAKAPDAVFLIDQDGAIIAIN